MSRNLFTISPENALMRKGEMSPDFGYTNWRNTVSLFTFATPMKTRHASGQLTLALRERNSPAKHSTNSQHCAVDFEVICPDKLLTKSLLREHGVATGDILDWVSSHLNGILRQTSFGLENNPDRIVMKCSIECGQSITLLIGAAHSKLVDKLLQPEFL